MAFKAAFIVIVPNANPAKHCSEIKTDDIEIKTVLVSSYEQAAQVARTLADDGCGAIELCAGFGAEGVALVSKAVRGKALVGVVRFDPHPCLGNKSGDELFV